MPQNPAAPECSNCHGAKKTFIDKGTHIDEVPCEACLGPIRDCSGGPPDTLILSHQPITFRGGPGSCPLCFELHRYRNADSKT